ncbi:hypothetical protein D3C78_800350 [compost metagenome]
MGAEFVPLARVQSTLQQGAEDRRLNVAPIGLGRCNQQLDLLGAQLDGRRVGEKATVELENFGIQRLGEAAAVHRPPQTFQLAVEGRRIVLAGLQQRGKTAIRQQPNVFREHGEQAAHQEAGDLLGAMAAVLQGFGQGGQPVGDGTGDLAGIASRIEAQRLQPDLAQQLAGVRVAQLLQGDLVATRVGKGHVVAARAAELGVQREGLADIGDDDERRAALVGRQSAGVVLGLLARLVDGGIPAVAAGLLAGVLAFEDEAAASVEVERAGAPAAVGEQLGDTALEDVGVFATLRASRIGLREVQQGAQLGDEHLQVGALVAAMADPSAPALDVRLDLLLAHFPDLPECAKAAILAEKQCSDGARLDLQL